MKKRLLYLFLTIASSLALVGCGSSAEAPEQSSNQGNALQSMFLSEDHFELRQESITIEYGTPLSEDLSQYVIAKDYEGITCEYEELWNSYDALIDNQPSTATFMNEQGKVLTMDVYYTDTTPPTIERTEYTFCTLQPGVGVSPNNIQLIEIMTEEHSILALIEDHFKIRNFCDYYGIDDNTVYDISYFSIDGISYELDKEYPSLTEIPPLDYGDHSIIITVYDIVGLSETFECTLHIVKDVSPEWREQLVSEYGYTEEQINAAVESFVNQE